VAIDWSGLLARKYDIMQQQADTQRLGIVSAARLDDVKAGLMPSESSANIRLMGANALEAGARSRNLDETTKFVGPLAQANIGLMGANAREAGARVGLLGAQTTGENQFNRMYRLGGMFSNDPLAARREELMRTRPSFMGGY
jgi:hypothetical protein